MKTRSVHVMAALSAAALASVLLVPGSSAVSATLGAAAPQSPALKAVALSATVGAASPQSPALKAAPVSATCNGTPTAGGTLTLAVQNQTLSLDPYNTPGGYGD